MVMNQSCEGRGDALGLPRKRLIAGQPGADCWCCDLQRKVSLYRCDDAAKVFISQLRHEVLPTTAASLSVQLVQALKADRVDHVALRPELQVSVAGQRIGAQQVMPVLLDLGRSRRNGDNGAELAIVGGGWGNDDDLAHLHHFGGYKPAREVAQQHVTLSRMVVERQSLDPIKARPPEGGLNRHAVELASPLLRRWLNPEREPDSCRLSPVTGPLCVPEGKFSMTPGLNGTSWYLLRRLAPVEVHRYSGRALANSRAGFGDPSYVRRTGAHHPIAGAFFVPAVSCYGGCAWETERSAGFLTSRFANPRTAATPNRLATVRGSSTTLGASTMHARNPSTRIAAWKARAFAALHADSSLSVRLARYNAAMARARALEAQGGKQ
ncbi:hypothetical protein FQZ97_612680 [compost metagenome]